MTFLIFSSHQREQVRGGVGYKTTSSAIAELIDNALEANAHTGVTFALG
jgi:hypothetical protein